ncbi:hypothetical protein BY996DRAFT_6420552 [Phakopsora pachyrhizi]|nr:hypothetical protein BY996DRAFT_6420552 [Phakopsora pachyrhizi]
MTERNSRLLIALRLIQIVLNKRERESDYVFLGGSKRCFGSSGYLKDPAAVAIVIANPVPVDLVADFYNLEPNYKLHKTNEPYGTHFPIISIFDMVRAQFKLLDHLVISKLFVSVGSNMGGMQSIVTAWLDLKGFKGCSHLTPHEKLCHSALIIFDSTTPDHCYQSNCHLIRKSFSTPSFPKLQNPQKRLSSLVYFPTATANSIHL